ncbi:MAG: CHAT domain-containing protein [Bacteroidales bacterium]|nr:CHAT domain-containing protein [Bacteroidales bacterium]
MKKILIIAFLLIFLIVGCQTLNNILNKASTGVDNIPDNVNNIVDDVTDQANDLVDDIKNTDINSIATNSLRVSFDVLIEETKLKIQESYNVTDFHYAISFGDNSSLYETKENFQNISSFSYFFLEKNTPQIVQARNYNSMGEILFLANKFESAEESFLKAYKIYKQKNYLDSTEAILNMSNLGLLYQTIGKFSLSEQFSLDALNHRNNNSADTVGYAATLNNLGVLYKLQGNFSESESYLNQAENFIKSTLNDSNMQYAIVLNNKAMLYQVINKIDDAELLMLQALDIVQTNSKEKSPTYVRFKVNLALLYQAKKVYSEAEAIYLEAIDLNGARLGKNHPDYAMLLRNLASLYMEMEKYDEVEPLLTQAKDIYESNFGTENPQYAKTNFQLGVYNQTVGNYDVAETYFNDALETQKTTLDEKHRDLLATYEYLAINYWHKSMPAEALQNYKLALDGQIFIVNNYFESMSDAEKTKFWNQIYPSFTRFYSFVAQNYQTIPELSFIAFNYHIQTKALLLNDSRKVKDRILSSKNPNLIAKYNEWVDLKNYTAKLFSLTNAELADRKINLDSIIQVTDYLEKELAFLSTDFMLASEHIPVTLNNIKANLQNDEAVVELIRADNYDYLKKTDSSFYMAIIVKNNTVNPEIVVFKDGPKMENTYNELYQNSIKTGSNMNSFYDYYWAEVDEKLVGVNKLYLSVDGIYNRVNINTLLKSDGTYIIDNYSVYFLTNSKDLPSFKQHISTTQDMNARNGVLFGFPNYSLGMPQGFNYVPPLPGTQIEVNNIKNMLTAKNWHLHTFMADSATELNLKNVQNPYILHIATHGYFLEGDVSTTGNSRSFGVEPSRAVNNPLLRSGLLLAGADETILNFNDRDNIEIDDGVLNAYEAMVMQLDQTQLVILSACQTGLGDIKTGEGVYGLQRAFQIAGTQTIITSLWEVSDEGTQELMSVFYQNWLQSGDEYDAFRKARLHIKDKYQYPYYWGAFVLVGK